MNYSSENYLSKSFSKEDLITKIELPFSKGEKLRKEKVH